VARGPRAGAAPSTSCWLCAHAPGRRGTPCFCRATRRARKRLELAALRRPGGSRCVLPQRAGQALNLLAEPRPACCAPGAPGSGGRTSRARRGPCGWRRSRPAASALVQRWRLASGTPTLPAFPRRPQLRFFDCRGAPVFDAIDEATREHAVSIGARVTGTPRQSSRAPWRFNTPSHKTSRRPGPELGAGDAMRCR
jgi:hypothetical protein